MRIYTKMKTVFPLICLLFGFGFLALGQEPGDVIWEFQTGDSLSSPAIGADGTVYVGSVDKVYALNGKTGAKKWQLTVLLPRHRGRWHGVRRVI